MASNQLTVGMPVSLSGRFQRQGQQALYGTTCWIEWINRNGGIALTDDRQCMLTLVSHDDESRPHAAKRVTQQLVRDDDVDILFGPYASNLTLAAVPVAEAHEIVLWNHGGATDALYDEGYRWLVSVLAPASRYFHGLIEMVRQLDASASTIAILWSGSGSFGSTVTSGAAARAHDLDFTLVLDEDWDSPLEDATLLVDEIRDTRPDLLIAAGSFEDEVRLARALTDHNHCMNAVGLVAAGVTDFGERLGVQADGVFGPSQWEPQQRIRPDYGPSPSEVVDVLQTASNQRPNYPAAQAFATGLVVQRCLEADAGDAFGSETFQQHLRTTAASLDITTFYGRFQIDPSTGKQVGQTPVVVQWQADDKRLVWPPEHQQTTPHYPYI